MTARRFTTADLENLTENITPGPWVNEEHELGPFWGDFDGRPGSNNPADEEALAALPELAADYHRVRTELEQLRQDMRYQPSSALASEVANAITIILNGETNE